MNYYERHLGDYARDTAHLSLLEHGVYTLLLDRYYATEQPIPADQAHRVARARSRDEKAAVDAVLAEFFTLEADGWHNKRADGVIAEFKETEPDREAKRENGKERVRRHRERRKAMFDTLREHGIVPDWDASTADLERMLKRVTSEPVTRYDTAIHTPDTNTQEQQLPIPQAPENSKARAPTAAGDACRLMRQAGCGHTNPAHPDLLAALDEGVTPQTLADTVREGIDAGKGNPFTWAIATARGRHAQGPRPVAAGPPHADATQHRMSKTALGIAALEDLKRETLDRMATGGNPDRPAEARLLVAGSDTSG